MKFCPKCGSLMTFKKEKDKKALVCRCGYVEKNSDSVSLKETVEKDKEIEVVDNEELKTLPTTEADCEKCGHKTAYYWTVQTRASDEPETKFLKCENCGHTWRDYS